MSAETILKENIISAVILLSVKWWV